MSHFKLLLLLCASLLLAACNSSSSSSARGYEMRIRYAQVTDVNRERLPTAAPAGAIVGGFTGLILSSGRSTRSQVASGIGGAALGALATSALEGDRLAYAYTLRYSDGTVTRFVTEKGYLQEGDCVAVERGRHDNIRRVPSSLCSTARQPGQAAPAIDPMIEQNARLCEEAKDQLLAAESEADINLAARKVEILCAY
jgi:hypothetical protein